MKNKHRSPRATLWRFGLRQSRRSALIVSLVVGVETILQGFGYAASYPTAASRAAFAASLNTVPGLGIIYGEPANLVSNAGYIVYRTVAFLSLIAAVWAIFTVTRLLRGFEEDGHWEVVAAGAVSQRRASFDVFSGFLVAYIAAYVLSTLVLLVGSAAPSLNLTVGESVRITAAIYLPGFVFASLGYIVSQLAITRKRALSYGLYPLIGFFMLRSLGNTIPDIYWLKNITPFGWAERFNPVLSPAYGWLALLGVTGIVCISLAVYLVGKRDLGGSLIPESDHVRPKFFLLKSPAALALRQTAFLTSAWAAAAIIISLMMAAIANVAAQAVSSSPSLKLVFMRLGSSSDLQVAFMGVGMVLTVIILLLAATTSIANIRGTEAKNYLDTILVAPVRRTRWLFGRLGAITIDLLVISLLSVLTTWIVAQTQHLSIDLGNLLLIGVTLIGTALFTLGIGTFLYGVVPRFASAGMYVVIGWSFLLDTISSVVTLNDLVTKSSLLHYVNTSLTGSPDWTTFAWLVCLGIILALVGVLCFNRRDIISE